MGEAVGDRGMKDPPDGWGLGIVQDGNNPGEPPAPSPPPVRFPTSWTYFGHDFGGQTGAEGNSLKDIC